jgi:anti-sigma regulatory factor (Ser/Thr protein kinase)
MSDRISLEVPATLSALPVVRMVLGGMGARLDFSLEDLDDLFLATDRLLQAALEAEALERLTIGMALEDRRLRIVAGSFTSADLRVRVGVTPGGCLDLCTLLRRLLDDVSVEEHDGSYAVVMCKHASGSPG